MGFLDGLLAGFNFEFFYGWFFRLSPIDSFWFIILVAFCVILYVKYGIFKKKKKRKKKKKDGAAREGSEITETKQTPTAESTAMPDDTKQSSIMASRSSKQPSKTDDVKTTTEKESDKITLPEDL